jgi:hypothetical protein
MLFQAFKGKKGQKGVFSGPFSLIWKNEKKKLLKKAQSRL